MRANIGGIVAAERELDRTDLALVELLKKDAWITHAQAGEVVNLSASAVQRRINRLRNDGVIQGATVKIDESRVGRPLRVYLVLELKNDSGPSLKKLAEELGRYPEVSSIELVTGKFDVLVELDCKDTGRFSDIAMTSINNNENVRHCWTLMKLKKLT